MRASLLHTYGGTVELGEHPDPEPGPDETLVQVSAAPIVPLDLLCAGGTSYFGRQPLPYVPGVQGVGVVRTSPDLSAGERVWFATSAGLHRAAAQGGAAGISAKNANPMNDNATKRSDQR